MDICVKERTREFVFVLNSEGCARPLSSSSPFCFCFPTVFARLLCFEADFLEDEERDDDVLALCGEKSDDVTLNSEGLERSE